MVWFLVKHRDFTFTYLLTYSLTHSLTHSVVQDIIWKADCHSARQKYPFFMEPEGSLWCSQKPYREPAAADFAFF
jgi:hypothetical protein